MNNTQINEQPQVSTVSDFRINQARTTLVNKIVRSDLKRHSEVSLDFIARCAEIDLTEVEGAKLAEYLCDRPWLRFRRGDDSLVFALK